MKFIFTLIWMEYSRITQHIVGGRREGNSKEETWRLLFSFFSASTTRIVLLHYVWSSSLGAKNVLSWDGLFFR